MFFDFIFNILLFLLVLKSLENLLSLKRYATYNQGVGKIINPLVRWFSKGEGKSGVYFALLFLFLLKCIFFMAERPSLEPIQLSYSLVVFTAEHPVMRDAFFKAVITFLVFVFRLEFFLLLCFLILKDSLYGGFVGFLRELVKPFILVRKKIFPSSGSGVDFRDLFLLLLSVVCFLLVILAINPNRILLFALHLKPSESQFVHVSISLLGVVVKDLSILMWFVIIRAISSFVGGGYGNSFIYFVTEITNVILKPFNRFNLHIGAIDFTPMAVILGFYFLQNILFNLLLIIYRAF